MDISTEKLELCSCRIAREAKAEQSVDCDITLPDYCSDIKSVLSCELEPGITGIDVTGNRITATGNAVVRLIYVGDDDKTACFEQNYPMSKFVEMNSLSPDCAVLVKPKVSYVNCRAVSPRRVDVHGCIAVLFSVLCRESVNVVSSAESKGLELKRHTRTAHSCIGCTAKLFEMSEVVPLTEGMGTVKSIAHTSAAALVTEIKAVADKILLKGEAKLNIVLCNEKGEISHTEHSLPISRIIELPGIDENSLCDVRVEIAATDVRLKTDDSGENAQLDLSVSLNALLCAYKQLSFATIEDAYSLCAKLEVQKSAVNFRSLAKKLDETFTVTGSLDFTSSPVGKILSSWCTDLTCVCGYENGLLELSGAVTVCVLYEDNRSKPCFAKRRMDYRHSVQSGEAANICFEPDIRVGGVSVSGSGERLEAGLHLSAAGCVFGCESGLAVTDMLLTEASSRHSGAAITVYFSDKGEQLWDIAKRFNTSVSAIAAGNSLNGDTVEENRMLIIPGA